MRNGIIEGKRVRRNTPSDRNVEIDEMTFENIKRYAGKTDEEISRRIKELDEELDIERILGLNMSTLAIAGFVLSGINRRWLILPAVVTGFFAQHAVQGWCPPLTLLRHLKIRTREEITQEKHALKAMRGDYKNINSPGEAFIAVRKVET
ncbi:MAG: hypothetical protein WEA56_10760 [Balneolaceae bacterium]